MADPNAQNAQQCISWFFQVSGLALDMVQTPADCLEKALAPLDNDPYINSLNKMIQKDETDHWMMVRFHGENEEDYQKRIGQIKSELQENNVWAHTVRRGETVEFITLKGEADKASQVFNQYRNYDDPVISNKDLNAISGGKIKEFKTNDVYAAYMFQKRCEANHIPVKVEAVSDIKSQDMIYKVRFRESDQNIMTAIKRNIAIDINDPAKELRKTQIDYEMKASLDNINKTLNLENKNMVIVGRNGTDLKIGENGVTIIKDGQAETVFKGSSDMSIDKFKSKVLGEMSRMGVTVAMTKEQYEQYQKSENKKDFLIDTERKAGRPVLSHEEIEIYKKAEQQRSIVESKLSQSHPAETRVDLNDYNNFESLCVFKTDEKIDFEAVHDASESQFSDANFYDDARAFDEGIMAEDLDVGIEADEIYEEMIGNDTIDVEITQEDLEADFEYEQEG